MIHYGFVEFFVFQKNIFVVNITGVLEKNKIWNKVMKNSIFVTLMNIDPDVRVSPR